MPQPPVVISCECCLITTIRPEIAKWLQLLLRLRVCIFFLFILKVDINVVSHFFVLYKVSYYCAKVVKLLPFSSGTTVQIYFITVQKYICYPVSHDSDLQISSDGAAISSEFSSEFIQFDNFLRFCIINTTTLYYYGFILRNTTAAAIVMSFNSKHYKHKCNPLTCRVECALLGCCDAGSIFYSDYWCCMQCLFQVKTCKWPSDTLRFLEKTKALWINRTTDYPNYYFAEQFFLICQ